MFDLVFAWLAGIASGIAPLVLKITSKSLVKDPWVFNLFWIAFGIPFGVTYGLVFGGGFPQDGRVCC